MLIFSIIGCEANGVVQSSKSNSEVKRNIISLTETINSSNVNILEQINNSELMKIYAEDLDTEFPMEKPILAPEEEAALKELYTNPRKVFAEIAKEEDGEEFISLMTAIVEQKDPEEIRSKLAYLLTVEELAEFDEQAKRLEVELQELAKTMAGFDKYLHWMFGGAFGLLAASAAYKALKWWASPWARAAALVVVSVSAAVVVGAAKEAYDYIDNQNGGNHSVEMADFWATVKGGGTAGTAAAAIDLTLSALFLNSTVRWVTLGIFTAIWWKFTIQALQTGQRIL